MYRIPFLIHLLALLPAIGWGQPAKERRLMDLVRLYEQGQDSIFSPNNNPQRVVFLQKNENNARKISLELETATDTNLMVVAQYLLASVEAFSLVAQYDLVHDSVSFSQLYAHRAAISHIDSTAFPLRFSVMGYQVVIRFADIRPDAVLYWQTVVAGCNCAQIRSVLPGINRLGEPTLAQAAQQRRKAVCGRRKRLKH